MNDLIYKQDAIDALEARKDKSAKGDIACFYNKIIQNDIDALKGLPSAQPKQQWIPVSEKMPKTDGTYLVTKLGYLGETIDVASFANDLYEVDDWDFDDMKGKAGWCYFDSEFGYCEMKDVIAWMPLPEPFKGGDDDE